MSGLREFAEPAGSPDDSQSIVGEEGLEVLQEAGQLLVRTGVEGDQRDFDIEGEAITDEEDVTLADPEDIGSTAELSGALMSTQEEPFRLMVVWQADDNETELFRQDFGTDTEFVIESVTTKSDHAVVLVTDESDDGVGNTVRGTLNFH